MTPARENEAGLTLVETLVALAILGLVAASAIALIGQNTRFIISAEDRLIASVVVDNLMTEHLARRDAFPEGSVEETIEFGGGAWTWRRTITETGVDALVRIDIEVARAADGQTLARATTLKRQ